MFGDTDELSFVENSFTMHILYLVFSFVVHFTVMGSALEHLALEISTTVSQQILTYTIVCVFMCWYIYMGTAV